MALKFLSNHTPGSAGSSKDVKVFEIRLDNDYIVFRGGEDEAASAHLSGSLVLCLADALMIHHVKLTLSGIVHMSYFTPSTSAISSRKQAYKEKAFYEKTWIFKDAGKGRSEPLLRDNYEWPFDVVLDGTLPESIEGLRDAWVVYRFKAEICRKRGKDLVVRKPLRLIRTLGATALELSHAMSVENVWPNKIEYSISTPSKAVVFGSYLQVDFKLIPLLKGLVIGNVLTQLKEEQEFVVDPEWGVAALYGGILKEDRIIAWDKYELQESDEQIVDEQAEGFQFSRYLELPKTLSKCLQDCNVKGIKVRHKIKFNVQLHNPDGHVSELRANLPVSLYISPNLPLNENNDLVDQTPQASRAAIENDLAHAAPPVYGRHIVDQIYSEVDLNGYKTPAAAFSTPGTPYSPSRNISSENVASLDAITSGSPHVSATALQYRLQNLRASDRALPTPLSHDDPEQSNSEAVSRRPSYGYGAGDYFSAVNGTRSPLDINNARISPSGGLGRDGNSSRSSQSGSPEISRHSSAEANGLAQSASHSPPIMPDPFLDLAKVPSYSTAVKTPVSRNTRTSEAPPTYGTVLSQDRTPALAEPPSAHLHALRSGSWSGNAERAAEMARNNVLANGRSLSQTRFGTEFRSETRSRSLAGRG